MWKKISQNSLNISRILFFIGVIVWESMVFYLSIKWGDAENKYQLPLSLQTK